MNNAANTVAELKLRARDLSRTLGRMAFERTLSCDYEAVRAELQSVEAAIELWTVGART